jgi:hypothetical protein
MLHLLSQHGILMNIQPADQQAGLPGAGDRPFFIRKRCGAISGT